MVVVILTFLSQNDKTGTELALKMAPQTIYLNQVCGDSLAFGASLKRPFEELQFLALHLSALEAAAWAGASGSN